MDVANSSVSKINLTPAQVRTHASTMASISEDIKNVNLTLKTMAEVTLAPWQGAAKDRFMAAFTEFYPKLQEASNVLGVVSSKLTETAIAIEKLDGQTAGE